MEKAIDKILLASNNLHKLNEINSFFEGKIKFILPKDIGIYQDYEENGLDFEENAILKVKEISEKIDIPVLADDSGLVVKLLSQIAQIIKGKQGLEFEKLLKNQIIKNQIIGKQVIGKQNIKKQNIKEQEKESVNQQAYFDKISNYFSEFCDPFIKENVKRFWMDYLPILGIFPGVVSKRFGYIEDEKKRNNYLISLLKYLSDKENIKKIFGEITQDLEKVLKTNLYTKENIIIKMQEIRNKKDKSELNDQYDLYNLDFESYYEAYFETSLALNYNNKIFHFTGITEGFIVDKPTGVNGFGYDPIFFYPLLGKTYAQLTMEEKNTVSHRSKALFKLKEFIETQS